MTDHLPWYERLWAIIVGFLSSVAVEHIHTVGGLVILGCTLYISFLRVRRERRLDSKLAERCASCQHRYINDNQP